MLEAGRRALLKNIARKRSRLKPARRHEWRPPRSRAGLETRPTGAECVIKKSVDPLLRWRAEFPILDRTLYMISHSLGAMPRRTRDRLQQYADEWDTRSIRAWEEGWWEMPVTVGDLIGKIIGAGPGEVVMQQNVSICQAIVLSCFDWSQ